MDEQRMWNWMREKRNKGADDDKKRPPQGGASRQPSGWPGEPDGDDEWAAGSTRRNEDEAPTRPPRRPVAQPNDPWAASRPAPLDDGTISEEAKKTLRAALEKFREQQASAPAEPRVDPPKRPQGRGGRRPTEPPVEEEVPEDDGSKRGPRGKREIQDALDYLDEVLDDYERLVNNIGNNEFTAPMTLYYRDEVQELLDELTWAKIDIQSYWLRTVELDDILREHAQELVDEIGWANFKQYQIINDPPRQYWWWYLNRETRSPAPPPAFWQFWKK